VIRCLSFNFRIINDVYEPMTLALTRRRRQAERDQKTRGAQSRLAPVRSSWWLDKTHGSRARRLRREAMARPQPLPSPRAEEVLRRDATQPVMERVLDNASLRRAWKRLTADTRHAARLGMNNIWRAARMPCKYFVCRLAHRLARDAGAPTAVPNALSMRSE
jgi:hypothetical protein